MLIVLAQALVSLAIEAYVFGEFQASLGPSPNGPDNDDDGRSPTTTIPTYLALFIFGFIYELVLAWDALRLKNTIQVIGICIYNVGMVIYSSVQMEQVDEAITDLLGNGQIEHDTWRNLKPLLIAAPCVIALGTVSLSFVAYKLYNEFAWTIYKHISADLRLKRRYLTYQVSNLHCLLETTSSFICPDLWYLRFTSPFLNLISSSFLASPFNSSW